MGIFTFILGTLIDVYHTVHNEHYRNLGYSYVLAFYAAVFLFIGFKYSFRSLRIAGFIVTTLLVGKFYFYDIWTMSKIVRIIAGFTLGAGFILVSLFYQKFKEKIINYQNTSGLFLFLLVIFASSFPLNAEKIDTKGYRYYKEIQIPKLSNKAGNVGEEENLFYGKIKLDEDIVRHSGINDRRIVHNGKTIPFISRNVMGAYEGGEKK
ncbi:membrane protein, PF10101 family [Leptospira interrogans serovar Bataviae str. HAI135]|nr:membrane protein, PF10101 family [Leptospira interrogans serovar Bataviae str. HAI135]